MTTTAPHTPAVPPPDSHADTQAERMDALQAAIVKLGDEAIERGERIDALLAAASERDERLAKLEKRAHKAKKALASLEGLMERTLEAVSAVAASLDGS